MTSSLEVNRPLSSEPNMRMKQRLRFSVWGLLYGLLFWLWAALGSGGGHYDLPLVLASPFGFALWPAAWFAAYDLHPRWARIAFFVLIGGHICTLAAYLLNDEDRRSDAYWFNIAVRQSPSFELLPWIAAAVLVSGQFFLWRRLFQNP
jgi:hypothetical protein